MHALGIGTQVKIVRPLLRAPLCGHCRPCDVGLPAVRKLELRSLATVRTRDEQHGEPQCATAAAAASSMSSPSRKRSIVNGALIGCGSSCAIVQAKTCAEPGVALKPPVPQPQFT